MIFKGIKTTLTAAVLFFCSAAFMGCSSKNSASAKTYKLNQNQLENLLKEKELSDQTRYAIVNKIAENMLQIKDHNSLILFLTEWVENNPEDMYNAYWLLMTAHAYMETNAEPIASYYFEKIIKNYSDLIVQGKSVHYICLQNLIRLSKNPTNKISYYNQLLTRFPKEVSITELYERLGIEYEKVGEWDKAIKSYQLFLEQDDAATIQIPGLPDAYQNTKRIIDFNNSPKDWTFESCDALVAAVKKAISTYNSSALDRYRSKVNFFAMSWRQEETDANAQESFSMRSFMNSNRIRYDAELDEMSSPTEGYLRTYGWSQYINTWYLYFRKVNFPADPDIHGRWEWAGIYFGEKL